MIEQDIQGHVVWLTGLAGSGKTSIGNQLVELWRQTGAHVIHLDGDHLREVFSREQCFTLDARLELSRSYSRLARMLSNQQSNVVVSTLSMFHEIHSWNRKNLNCYTEIFLDVSKEVLICRDQKQLYSRALAGENIDVVGLNVDAELPSSPDITFKNDGEISIENAAHHIWQKVQKRIL